MFSSAQYVRNKQRNGEMGILQPRNEKKELERTYGKDRLSDRQSVSVTDCVCL